MYKSTVIYNVLQELGIRYTKKEHPTVFTIEEASQYQFGSMVATCKNLFLKNNLKNKYYLIVVMNSNRLDLVKIAKNLGEKRINLASEKDLFTYLGISRGSVSPLALINNQQKDVVVIIDRKILTYEKVAFHPNINTATLIFSSADFAKFLHWTGNKIKFMNFDTMLE